MNIISKFAVIKSEKVVNKETGEITYRDTIERKPQELINVWNPYKKEQHTKHIKRRSSIEARKLCLTLNNNEKSFLFTLEPYLQWETNLLLGDGVTAGKKNKPLLWKDIDKLTKLDKRTRQKIVESLTDKNIIGYLESEHKRKGIVINPLLMFNGKKPTNSLLKAFLAARDVNDEEI